MLVFFNRNDLEYLIVDDVGKYYGIFHSLKNARQTTNNLMNSTNPPKILLIYQIKILEQINAPITLHLTSYQSSI